jgi:hypothetical protein
MNMLVFFAKCWTIKYRTGFQRTIRQSRWYRHTGTKFPSDRRPRERRELTIYACVNEYDDIGVCESSRSGNIDAVGCRYRMWPTAKNSRLSLWLMILTEPVGGAWYRRMANLHTESVLGSAKALFLSASLLIIWRSWACPCAYSPQWRGSSFAAVEIYFLAYLVKEGAEVAQSV